MRLKHPDLLVILVITLLTLTLGISNLRAGNSEFETLPLWMAPLGILMVLFIPGYAITSAILPHIGSERILLLSLGLSISISAVGGLALNLTPWGLTPTTCVTWLSLITLISLIYAWRQRGSSTKSFEIGVPTLQKENIAVFGWAATILLGSVLITYVSSKQAETTFTQLWAIPLRTAENQYEIQIGIRNEEKQPETYNLYIGVDGRRLEEWPEIPLESGNEWTTVVQLVDKPSNSIRINLYRVNDLNKVYRWLRLSPEAFK